MLAAKWSKMALQAGDAAIADHEAAWALRADRVMEERRIKMMKEAVRWTHEHTKRAAEAKRLRMQLMDHHQETLRIENARLKALEAKAKAAQALSDGRAKAARQALQAAKRCEAHAKVKHELEAEIRRRNQVREANRELIAKRLREMRTEMLNRVRREHQGQMHEEIAELRRNLVFQMQNPRAMEGGSDGWGEGTGTVPIISTPTLDGVLNTARNFTRPPRLRNFTPPPRSRNFTRHHPRSRPTRPTRQR